MRVQGRMSYTAIPEQSSLENSFSSFCADAAKCSCPRPAFNDAPARPVRVSQSNGNEWTASAIAITEAVAMANLLLTAKIQMFRAC